ncbi:hypothetical protein FAZ79_11125 [Guyparkeria sp. SB14A]|uniref:HvfC family RiPP maturation protein n=1 Tax=Guyparkeria sp. SB14A TaxID=2571147 RepID=UPI0010AD06B5|nr:putative DNA-binding domain-containing protein [Guyparkeria sp. SB14A]TKA88303.1 hypothetical protein FAZ79_11125 [Guyparkeria sp. SB14A]
MGSSFKETQEAFTRYVRDPETNPPPPGSKPERMAWYAKLFFNNIDGTLENAFPALRASLDEADWQGLTRPFFRDHPAHSPILRDLPAEFAEFLQERPELADWQRELAAYELARFELMAEDADPAPADLDADGDLLAGQPVVSSLVRLMVTAYPVDRLAAASRPARGPKSRRRVCTTWPCTATSTARRSRSISRRAAPSCCSRSPRPRSRPAARSLRSWPRPSAAR